MTRKEISTILEDEFGLKSCALDIWEGSHVAVGLFGEDISIYYSDGPDGDSTIIKVPMDSMPVEVFRAWMFEVFVSLRRD